MGVIFVSEVMGTAMLLLGCGVVANAILPKTKGFGGGWLLIYFGWGPGVFSGVFVAGRDVRHLALGRGGWLTSSTSPWRPSLP